MKKLFAIFLIFILLFSLAACDAANAPDEMYDYSYSAGGSGGYKGEADGGKVDADVGEDIAELPEGAIEGEFFGEADAELGGEEGGNVKPSAGLLTAGEWSDLENIDFWTKLLNRNDWYSFMEQRDLYANSIKKILVKDSEGAPCYNAKVELLDGDGDILYIARTDVTGQAYLFYNLNKGGKAPRSVRVNSNVTAELSEGVTEVTLGSSMENVEALDLMFMIDTTGSMSDELRYLQTELGDVISRVARSSDKTLSIRVSVNFYRDRGDDYILRSYDFTDDIDDVMDTLNQQSAGGGGDYREAVHTALENAILEHEWRDDAVKLMFMVLDAPPHTEDEIQGINSHIQDSVTKAAEMGVRIIPVASSGVDTETEFLLRSYAAMTGGTYIFLTNHSGIGGDHLEPTIGQYEVEPLNECLIRVISEYCGLIAPDVNENGNEKEADSLVAWANSTGHTEKISRLACNADKLLEGFDSLPIYKCESLEELEKFKSVNSDIYSMNGKWDEIGSFNDATANFGEEYFKDGALLIVYVATNSCTPRYGLHSIVGTGNGITVYIEQTNDPKVFDEAMGGWLITVPVEKALIQNATAFDAMMK